ncbi:MAG: ankyrin repeat domain-containing protein [Bacteroidota bacterium]
MKAVSKYSLFVFFIHIIYFSFSQEKNILLDRKFWKAQPTIEEVQAKIEDGHSPTAMTPYNFDATSYAILEKLPLETVKFLLDQGNDVNKLTHDARTYIFWAAYKGNLALMNHLISKGAKPDIIDQHGYSLFMFAAVTGQENQEIYDYIIELGADVMTEKDRQSRNALLAYAGGTKTGSLVDYFINKGLDVHSTDKDGNGIFNHAARTGNVDLMKRLIQDYQVSIEKNEETNENAILFASTRYSRSGEESDLAFYQYLEGLGLDPAIVSKEGNTALLNLASRSKNIELFQYFIDKGIDVNQVNEEGDHALIKASSGRSKEIVALLANHTQDINHQNDEGISSFTQALKFNKLEIAKLLVERGADVKVIDKKGHDLGYHLIDAFRGKMSTFNEKMDYLISLGYDPLVIQKDGTTLLHAAVNKENVDLLKSLVEMGMDINAKDGSGHTVLHYAAMQANDGKVLRYLVDAGADKNVTTEFDESAFDLAQSNEILSKNNTDIGFLRTGGE